MSDWLMRVIKSEAQRLIELAAEDDELRADLRALAQSILAATASASNVVDNVVHAPSPADGAPPNAQQAAEPLRELTLGRSLPPKSDPRPVASSMPLAKPRAGRSCFFRNPLSAKRRGGSLGGRTPAEAVRGIMSR